MQINILDIRKSLNKAFLKVKPNRTQIETFKKNIINLFDQINESESEEFHKNILLEFLKNTWYSPDHYINTKGRADLVIHSDKDANTPVGVLFETKKPSNRNDMPTTDNLNSKALHELILYYLRERITGNNINIKYLVITNIYEWFIFSSNVFEHLFASNKKLVRNFTDFEEGRLGGTTTDFFYKNIADPFVKQSEVQLTFTHFDIRYFEEIIRNTNQQDDIKLISLYKIFSPEHLLRLPFANDSNSLDKAFYTELLHIIGLEESKDGSKKVIGRKKEGIRNPGSLIENAITILKYEDCLSQIPNLTDYGSTKDEQLYNIALELSITWINRILFLKLLESQLLKYNKGNKDYLFLNIDKVPGYDTLNKLFFQVLAVKINERAENLRKKYINVPFLNSSLFEPTDLEHKTIRISNLDDNIPLTLISNTVLKNKTGKRLSGEKQPLCYLFDFLDAYDFSSEGAENIQEENKTLINASVLGLIFEKINGYKEGSFFTPGLITMYMCHETISKAVIQKFNNRKGWNCETLIEIHNKIDLNITEANEIINSIKICDPAVGSGHFLVSALNEIISIKAFLGILVDKTGKKFKDYVVEVINDELVITDVEGNFFEYNPASRESLRVQETLFKEKQIIIENCLFGVDINPNSVKICRLRLWIELLKNSYYKTGSQQILELETLPNIDINIKCGNSLISRYPLDADISKALKSSKWTVDNYREAVMTYRNAQSKEEKRAMEQLIEKIKNDFETEVAQNDKRFLKLNKLKGDLLSLTNQGSLFDKSKKEKEIWNKNVSKISEEIKNLEDQITGIKNNKIYKDAFEWRFEFPEILNYDGDFVGFDLIIGNPPYIPLEDYSINERAYFGNTFEILERKYDSSVMFFINGLSLLNNSGLLSYIAPITWQTGENYSSFRKWIFTFKGIEQIINLPFNIFEDAYVETAIYFLTNFNNSTFKIYRFNKKEKEIDLKSINFTVIPGDLILPNKFKIILNPLVNKLLKRLNPEKYIQLGMITISTQGLSGSIFKETNIEDEDTFIFLSKGNVYNYWISEDETFITSLKKHKSLKQFYDSDDKILIRRLINRQDRLSVCYTNKRMIYKKDINPFIPTDKDFPAKYLLAVMASKLISFLYINISSIATKDDFRQTTLTELRELPIPLINSDMHSNIIKTVDKILHIKKLNPESDTSSLESKIDLIVYDLYGLTKEEIKIVENSI